MEKDLILEEVTTLCDRLHKQTVDGRTENTEIGGKLNDLSKRIRHINKALMAKSSELAMVQSQFINLQREVEEKVFFVMFS